MRSRYWRNGRPGRRAREWVVGYEYEMDFVGGAGSKNTMDVLQQ